MTNDKRAVPAQGAVNGWYVYLHAICSKGYFIPFFVGVSNKEYEFRRYSNRPKTWAAIANLLDRTFHTTVLIDQMEDYKTASMMYRIVVNYYHRRNSIIINDPVELKKTPFIDFKQGIVYHLKTIINAYQINAKINGHSMYVDMKKRNYHPDYLATNNG